MGAYVPGFPAAAPGSVEFENGVRINTPNQLATPTSAFNMGGQRITNVAAPALTSDVGTGLGQFLGGIAYGTTGLGTEYTGPTTATWTAIDSTNLTLSLTPISAVVWVEILGFFRAGATGAPNVIALADHGSTTPVSDWSSITSAATTADGVTPTQAWQRVSSLTAGTAVQWDLIWALTTGSTAGTLYVTDAVGTSLVDVGPLIMRAYAG